MDESGNGSGSRWTTPAGVSALAAAAAVLVGVGGLIVQAGGEDPPAEATTTPTGAAAALSRQATAPVDTDPGSQTATAARDSLTFPEIADVSELAATVETAATAALPPGDELRFTLLRDDGYGMGADVPRAWGEQEVGQWIADDSDDVVGLYLFATPDVSRLYNAWDTPGVWVAAGEDPGLQAEDWAERKRFYESECAFLGGNVVANERTEGSYRVWEDCGTADSMTIEYRTDNVSGLSLYVMFRLVEATDADAVAQVLRSLEVDLPVRTGATPARDDAAPGFVLP